MRRVECVLTPSYASEYGYYLSLVLRQGNIIALFCPFSPPLDFSHSAGRSGPFGQRVGLLRAGFLRT